MNVMNTDKPVSLYQRVVTYLILTLFTVQPALANVVVSGSGNTSVETAANGVEVVNIATPNSKGLSHNKYQKFNVDPSGLVLNNSTEQFKRSELAGILQNNANLNSSGSASVILNEVTGANRSQLQGYTEVLGQSANVILTNPYGITCDGCGFINTPRVTLSTGAAQIQNGEVSGFEVAEGTVTVQGLGLDATRQSYFDIIARTAEINAQINANQLNVITGKNRVDYQSNAVTKRASDDNRPALAIDSSSLGGMYAGRISLIATEEGVGVNVGNLAASQGNLTITADGKITLADASATQNIELVTKNDLALSGTHSAGNDLSVSATQVTATDSKSVAGGTLSLSAQSATITNASLEAGTLTSNTAQVTLDNQSSLKSQTANLSGLASLNNDGMVSASNALSVTGNQVTLSGGGSVEANQVNLTSDSLDLDTTLRAQNLTIDSQGALNLSNQSKVSASDTANLTAQNLSHNGELSTTNALSMKASHTISNTGNTQAGSMNIEAASISNTGMLAANQAMALNADNVTLAGEVGAADITVTSKQLAINGAVSATGQSTLTANNSLTVSTGAKVMSGNAMTINTTNLTSQGVVQSNDSLSVTAKTGNVQGTLTSQKAMTLSGDTLEQSGTLYSGGDLTLTQTDSVSLKGNVDVKGAVNVNTDTLDSQTRLVTDKSLTVTAGNITNSGLLSATQALTINADTLNQSGDMLTEDNLSINARQVTLGGNTAADKVLSVQSRDSITTSASASVYGATGVDMGTVSLIQQGSLLSSGENLSLTATTLTNNGKISADGQTNITVSGKLSNQSAGMISGQSTALQAGSITNHGRLQALDALGLSASSLTNYGAVVAQGDVTTNLTGTLTNRGVIYAGNHGYLHANALNNYSDILTQKNLTIARNSSNARSSSLLNSSGTIESLGGDINIYADKVTNKRTTLITQPVKMVDKTNQFGSVFNSFGTAYQPVYEEIAELDKGDHGARHNYFYELLSDPTFSVEVKKEGTKLSQVSSVGKLVSGNDIHIDAGTILNNASQIAGRNIQINANTLNNKGYLFDEYTTTYDYQLDRRTVWYGGRQVSGRAETEFHRTAINRKKTASGTLLNASITATGNITLNVANKVNNSTIKSNASKVAPTGNRETNQSISTASGNVDAAEVVAIGETAITLPAFNTVPYPDYRLPTGPNSLFIYTTEPKSRYLIETNPLLTDLGSYLGSDYFQDKVGISTGEDVTFLGDAFYDTRVITQAIFEQTGKRYLSKNIGSDLSQMQSLMDAAAKEKTSLDLTVGVSLTQQQVAQLSSDIIWYEQIEVNGQQVLAPKLYLAQVSQENVSNGALIAGRNVTVQGGDIENSGQILAGSTLSLTSDGKISNDTGSLKAGGDATLKAEGDITNISGTISGDKVSLVSTNGSVVNETLSEQVEYDQGATRTYSGKTASITASDTMTVSAGKDIVSQGANIGSGGDMSLEAGENIVLSVNEEKYHNRAYGHNALNDVLKVKNQGSSVTANGNLTVKAGKDIKLTNATISSGGDTRIDAGEALTIDTAQDESYTNNRKGRRTDIRHTKTHKGSTISGDDVELTAGDDLSLIGSSIDAKNNASLSASGDVSVLAVNDSDYRYFKETTKKSFGRSKTTIKESLYETVKGSQVDAGGNITITAQANKHAKLAGGDSNIQVIGSELSADGSVNLSADGDVILSAQQYKEYSREETIKKGFGGLSGKNKGSIDDATLLEGSYALSGSNINIHSGNDIAAIGSEVVADGEVNLTALNEVLISAGEVLKQHQQWDEKTSLFSGGHLFEMESRKEGQSSITAKSSLIRSGGDIDVDAGSVKVVGSNISSGQSVKLSSDIGDVEIVSAKETRHQYLNEEKLSVGFDLANKLLTGDVWSAVSVEDGKLKVGLGSATYDKVDEKSESLTNKGSHIQSAESITVNSDADILVSGSSLEADTDSNQSGDITLTAKNNVVIEEATDTYSSQREEVHGKAEASFVVQHQAVEVAKAVKALKESTERLKQAKEDYSRFKKQVSSLEQSLSALEEDYKNKVPGVSFADVEELRDLVADVNSDESWYQAGIALAAEDVVSKTTLAYQQGSALATSTSSYAFGFNAGLELDVSASKSEEQVQSTSSVASSLSGQNVTITGGKDNGDVATIKGSHVKANEKVSVEANEVNILASTDTHNSQGGNESVSGTVSMTLFGATGGANVNLGYSKGSNSSSAITHTNSTLSGETMVIASEGDTNIKGANLSAEKALSMNVKGNLNIESVADRVKSNSKSMGASAGLSLSAADSSESVKTLEGVIHSYTGEGAGDVTGVNGGTHTSSNRSYTKKTILTTITSGGTADINVANNTDIKGALVATVDEEGKDLGNLTLSTNTLSYANLTNTNYNQDRSLAVNGGVGVNGDTNDAGESAATDVSKDQSMIDATYNTTSIQYKNESGYSKSKTLATIGQGNLTIKDSENSDDTSSLNRDTEHTEKDLFTVDRKQGDIDVTVDHRLLSEDGWKAIAEDVEDTHEGIGDVADAAGSVTGDENIGIGDLFTVLGNNRKNTELKNDLTRDPKYAHIVEGLKSEDSAAYAKAAKEVYKLALEKYGLQPSELNFYDGSKTTSASLADSKLGNVNAGVVVDKNSDQYGKTFVNASEGNTKLDHAKGMGAEIVEIQGLQNGQQSTSEATQEAISEHNSGHFAKRLDQATEGGLSNTSPSFSTMFSNSNAVKTGTNVANKVGTATVDHRQLYKAESQLILSNAKGYAEKHGISEVEAKKELFQQALLQTDETWANQKHIQENSRAREKLAEIAADNASELANSASGRKLVEDGSELFKAKDETTYKDETVNLDEFNSIEHPYQSDYRPNEEANVYAKYATENGEKPVNVSTSDVANNLKEKALNVIDNTSVEDVVNVGEQVVDIVIEKAKYNAGHVKENIRTTPEQLGELATETLNSLKQVFENNDDATLAEIKELQGNKQEAIELKEKGLVTTGETVTTIATVGGVGKNLLKKGATDLVESVDLPEIPAVGSNKSKLTKLDIENKETAILTYKHQLKDGKTTDILELERQVKGQEDGYNKIIREEGIDGLKERINNFKADPSIAKEGRRRTAGLGPAGEGKAHLHNPDMATGGNLDPDDIGKSRENSILGGNANRIANEILDLPDTTTCIECKLELKPPKSSSEP